MECSVSMVTRKNIEGLTERPYFFLSLCYISNRNMLRNTLPNSEVEGVAALGRQGVLNQMDKHDISEAV